MGLVLTDLLAAPMAHTPARDGDERIRRPSSPPPRSLSDRGAFFVRSRSLQLPRRRDWAMSFAGWGLRSHEVVTPHPASPSMRSALAALERVNVAVRADQLVADRCLPQGDLRPT